MLQRSAISSVRASTCSYPENTFCLRHARAAEGCDEAGGRVQSLAPGGQGRCSRALAEWREGGGWQPGCAGGGQGHGRALGHGFAGVRTAGEASEEGLPDIVTESLQRRVVQEY